MLAILVLLAVALLAVSVTSYRMGRADERRAHELRDHIWRVIGGGNA